MPVREPGIFVNLSFPEHHPIGALDLSSFLFDINRLYTVAFRAEQDPYEIVETRFGGYGRGSFRVPKRYQLDVSRIRFQSPGLLVLSTGLLMSSAAAIWTVVQIIDKVSFWPLQKAKLRLEEQKLHLEIFKLEKELGIQTSESRGERRRLRGLEERIEPILTLPVTQSAIKQLSANPLKPTDLTLEIALRRPSD
jgi:hypothetical protein